MSSFTKAFRSMLTSALWSEPDHVRIVWITLLLMADENGVAETSIPGLAHLAHESIEDTEAAIAKFAAPDPYSRTKENEGRRIEVVDGGFRLLNHGKYRERMNREDRREYQRRWDAERRPNRPSHSNRPPTTPDNPRQNPTTPDTARQNPTPPTHTEAEAEADHSLSNAVELPAGFPKTEQEAVDRAFTAGVPEDFIRTTWKLAMGRGGRDSRDVLIRSWVHHLQTAYTFGKSREAEQTERANGRTRMAQVASERKTGWKEPQDQTLMPKRLL